MDFDEIPSTATFYVTLTLTFPVQGHLIFLQYITWRLTFAFKFVLSVGSSQNFIAVFVTLILSIQILRLYSVLG